MCVCVCVCVSVCVCVCVKLSWLEGPCNLGSMYLLWNTFVLLLEQNFYMEKVASRVSF